MKQEYYSEEDILRIVLVPTPYETGGAEDTDDPDVVIHYDASGRLAEIEIEHASERFSAGELISFPQAVVVDPYQARTKEKQAVEDILSLGTISEFGRHIKKREKSKIPA